MSHEVTGYVLDNIREGLTPAQKLMLIAYADFADEDGCGTWMTKTKLRQRMCGVSDSTIIRNRNDLLVKGYLREGDQERLNKYWKSQPVISRPIVYDMALDEETRAQWAASYTPGPMQAAATAAGKKGGRPKRTSPAGGGEQETPVPPGPDDVRTEENDDPRDCSGQEKTGGVSICNPPAFSGEPDNTSSGRGADETRGGFTGETLNLPENLPLQGGEPPVGPPGPEREPSLPADAPAAAGGSPPDMPASEREKNPGRDGQAGPEPAVPGMLAADPEIAALAAEVLAIRPGWTETAVTVAIANARKGPDSWETIREVMLDVARDQQSCYPARLMPQLLLRRNGPRPPKPGRQASTRPQRIPLPDGWQPTEAMLRVASRRFPSLDLHAETALFIRHYRGEETRAANWASKWEEWLQRQEKWAAERERRQAAAAPRTATSDQRVAQVDAVMARRRAARNSAGQEPPEPGHGAPPGAPVITAKPEWLDDVISTVSEM